MSNDLSQKFLECCLQQATCTGGWGLPAVAQAMTEEEREILVAGLSIGVEILLRLPGRPLHPEVTDYVKSTLALTSSRLNRPLVYLAVPYSHDSREVRVRRFEAANRAAARLLGAGRQVFSPISHTHPIAEAGTLPGEWEFWKGYARTYLGLCHRLIVLTIDGWQESIGVQAEIKIADELGIPIEYLDAETPEG